MIKFPSRLVADGRRLASTLDRDRVAAYLGYTIETNDALYIREMMRARKRRHMWR